MALVSKGWWRGTTAEGPLLERVFPTYHYTSGSIPLSDCTPTNLNHLPPIMHLERTTTKRLESLPERQNR